MDKSIQDIKLLRRIEDIGLPDNIASDLRWYGNIKTLKKLIETDVVDLLKIYGIGDKKVEIIISALGEMGLSIPDSRTPKSLSKTPVIKTGFPNNLLAYIAENKTNFNCPENVTKDIIDGIHYACLSLTEKQQATLYLRFECHQTLEKIGARFSLSGSQIANIINASIVSWFKTGDIKYVEYGLKGYMNHTVISRVKSLIQTSIIQEYEHGYKDGYEDGYNKSKDVECQHKKLAKHMLEVKVEELDLSVRSYNCIKRAGINTLQDLLCRSEDDMRKVRNLGKKGFEEIENKLHEMGLYFCGTGTSNSKLQLFYYQFIKQFTFSAVDGLFGDKIEMCISIDANGKVVATKSIYDEDIYTSCEILPKLWEQFFDEAIIINDIINWEQERFEEIDIDECILNDMSYRVKFVLADKTIEFFGGTSSKGVRLVKDLFFKYIEPSFEI